MAEWRSGEVAKWRGYSATLQLRNLAIVFILLVAFAFRTHQLSSLPPGLTHDEANHGREAIGVLDGELLFYFPLNYGSEPLYSYTAAGSMALLGEGVFALRLVNVFASILAMAVAYAWAKRAFGWKTAVTTIAITAVSFWAVASSREALRAGLMPLFMTTAVYFFHRLTAPPLPRSPAKTIVAFAVAVAATVHIYLSSRVAWLMYPAFLLYLALFHRDRFRAAWKSVAMGLLLAGVLVIPLFAYLQFHPEALTRLDMLDGTLDALKTGDLRPLLTNISSGLRAFVQPGAGDQFLAYNIPGRPVFVPLTALFFLIGTAVSIWKWRQPNYALLLLWFGAGISASLITGATANTTRNMAALTAVYTLPALGFVHSSRWIGNKIPATKKMMPIVGLLWLLIAGGATARDYFVEWGQSPAVRDAYQQNLVGVMGYIGDQGSGFGDRETAVSISSTQPNVAHDPSIALVLAPDIAADMRWMDARRALIAVDGVENRAFIPASTPPHEAFEGWLTAVDHQTTHPDDLNPSFTVYELSLGKYDGQPIANFNDGIVLLQAEWVQPTTKAGETASLMTIWRVLDPERVGPKSTPLNTTDVVMFTQVLTESGGILGQDDRLDAPSWAWQMGDLIVQIHEITVGEETAVNEYKTIVGLYDRASGERLTNSTGVTADTFAIVDPLKIR